eukprot:9404947-Pyramimonas_sp.AAC.1
MRGVPLSIPIRIRVQRKKIPTNKPVGCIRQPEHRVWSWDFGNDMIDFLDSWEQWLDNAELEMCRICDIYGDARPQYLGKSQGFQRKALSLELILRKKWFSNTTPQLRAWRSL